MHQRGLSRSRVFHTWKKPEVLVSWKEGELRKKHEEDEYEFTHHDKALKGRGVQNK